MRCSLARVGWNPASNPEAGGTYFGKGGHREGDASELRVGYARVDMFRSLRTNYPNMGSVILSSRKHPNSTVTACPQIDVFNVQILIDANCCKVGNT